MDMRTVGVEEELILVDADTGRPIAVASEVLQVAAEHGEGLRVDIDTGSMVHELQQEQLETYTPPESDLDRLAADLRTWRDRAVSRAAEVGASVIASATSPFPVDPHLVHKPRYEQMAERFGLTASEQLAGGCHVHVSVDSLDEAVGVLDRIRIWLPTLLALSANSPFWGGADTGYASFRSQLLVRWPTSGPTELFGSAEAYRQHRDNILGSGVPIDEGMIYTDARVSRQYPTVEIRVADVCLDLRDAVLIAALCRGLVETAAREYAAGDPPPSVSTSVLRLASWQAGKSGISDDLLDPVASRPRPARDAVEALVAHVGQALTDSHDETVVDEGVRRVFEVGTGATRQHAVMTETDHLIDVVSDLISLTASSS
jgi:glutamate---cysteine ligase / carboxylate-amine ligase